MLGVKQKATGARLDPSNGRPALDHYNYCPSNDPLNEQLRSKFIQVPGPNTENDDHNPQRIAPRHLFDIAAGRDNLFHGDRFRSSFEFTVINLIDKVARYNFFSTFRPRTDGVEPGFHF